MERHGIARGPMPRQVRATACTVLNSEKSSTVSLLVGPVVQ